jgi:hypothetical protein
VTAGDSYHSLVMISASGLPSLASALPAKLSRCGPDSVARTEDLTLSPWTGLTAVDGRRALPPHLRR